MRRNFKFALESYYHVCNKSNDEQSIFLEKRDYIRFLFLILYCQAPLPYFNIGRQINFFVKHRMFNISRDILATQRVVLNAFAIMPNHFHLLLQEKTEGGISWYLQRIQNGYAKYFNVKYKKRGHLFQGSFRGVPVETDNQMIYLSSYIHRNPRDISAWKEKELLYPWSSYQDCVQENRWEELLQPSIFLNQFSNPEKYRNFVETSMAKLHSEELAMPELFIE